MRNYATSYSDINRQKKDKQKSHYSSLKRVNPPQKLSFVKPTSTYTEFETLKQFDSLNKYQYTLKDIKANSEVFKLFSDEMSDYHSKSNYQPQEKKGSNQHESEWYYVASSLFQKKPNKPDPSAEELFSYWKEKEYLEEYL